MRDNTMDRNIMLYYNNFNVFIYGKIIRNLFGRASNTRFTEFRAFIDRNIYTIACGLVRFASAQCYVHSFTWHIRLVKNACTVYENTHEACKASGFIVLW